MLLCISAEHWRFNLWLVFKTIILDITLPISLAINLPYHKLESHNLTLYICKDRTRNVYFIWYREKVSERIKKQSYQFSSAFFLTFNHFWSVQRTPEISKFMHHIKVSLMLHTWHFGPVYYYGHLDVKNKCDRFWKLISHATGVTVIAWILGNFFIRIFNIQIGNNSLRIKCSEMCAKTYSFNDTTNLIPFSQTVVMLYMQSIVA